MVQTVCFPEMFEKRHEMFQKSHVVFFFPELNACAIYSNAIKL